jgi:hypothetical protein
VSSLIGHAQNPGVATRLSVSVTADFNSQMFPWIVLPSSLQFSPTAASAPSSANIVSSLPPDMPVMSPQGLVSPAARRHDEVRGVSLDRSRICSDNGSDGTEQPGPYGVVGAAAGRNAQGVGISVVEASSLVTDSPAGTRDVAGAPVLTFQPASQSDFSPFGRAGRTFTVGHQHPLLPASSDVASPRVLPSPTLPVPVPRSAGLASFTSSSSYAVGVTGTGPNSGIFGLGMGGAGAYSPKQTALHMEELGVGSVEARDFLLPQRAVGPSSFTSTQPVAVPGTSPSSSSHSLELGQGQSSLHTLAAASDAANGGVGSATIESLAAVSAAMFTNDLKRTGIDSASSVVVGTGTGGTGEGPILSRESSRDGRDILSLDEEDRRYAMFRLPAKRG